MDLLLREAFASLMTAVLSLNSNVDLLLQKARSALMVVGHPLNSNVDLLLPIEKRIARERRKL